jgi:hypothetical protein
MRMSHKVASPLWHSHRMLMMGRIWTSSISSRIFDGDPYVVSCRIVSLSGVCSMSGFHGCGFFLRLGRHDFALSISRLGFVGFGFGYQQIPIFTK